MAREAERLLADTGWLPEPLRLIGYADASTPEAQVEGEDDGAVLPDFLADDDEEIVDDNDDEEQHLAAAE